MSQKALELINCVVMENVRRQLGASRYFLSFHCISHPFSTKNAFLIGIEITQQIIHKYWIPNVSLY